MAITDELRLADVLAAYFSLPLFVSSVYGMNIELPLQGKWYAFWLFVALCVVWAVIVTAVGMQRNTTTDVTDMAPNRLVKGANLRARRPLVRGRSWARPPEVYVRPT